MEPLDNTRPKCETGGGHGLRQPTSNSSARHNNAHGNRKTMETTRQMPPDSHILLCNGDASTKQTQNTSRAVAHTIPKMGLICHTTQQRNEQKRCEAHKQQSDSQRQTREGHASAQTRMHLRKPDLYIEHRQNKKAKIAHPPVGRKRKRLPTLVDTHPNPLLPPLLFSIVENSGSAGVCWAPGPHSLSPLSFFLSYLILTHM